MSKIVFIFFVMYAQLSFGQQSTKTDKPVQFPSADQYSNTQLTYKIIPAANKTFCYDIFSDGKMMIHQPSVPGMPGNEGFKTKAGAEKVANYVIEKIKKGEMPPSITKEEMDKLKVL